MAEASIMTLVWGFGLLAETTLACVPVFIMPVRDYLVANAILGYSVMGLLGFWSYWYGRHRRKQRSMAAAEQSLYSP